MTDKPAVPGVIGPPLKPNVLVIHKGAEALVTIDGNGAVTFGPSYTPDVAARIFWEGVGSRRPHCPHCGGAL